MYTKFRVNWFRGFWSTECDTPKFAFVYTWLVGCSYSCYTVIDRMLLVTTSQTVYATQLLSNSCLLWHHMAREAFSYVYVVYR